MVSLNSESYFIFYLIQNNNKLNDPWHPTWPRRLQFKFHPRKVYKRKFEITFGVVIRGNYFGFDIPGLNENGCFWLNCENRNLIKIRELRINIFNIVLQLNILSQKSM